MLFQIIKRRIAGGGMKKYSRINGKNRVQTSCPSSALQQSGKQIKCCDKLHKIASATATKIAAGIAL